MNILRIIFVWIVGALIIIPVGTAGADVSTESNMVNVVVSLWDHGNDSTNVFFTITYFLDGENVQQNTSSIFYQASHLEMPFEAHYSIKHDQNDIQFKLQVFEVLENQTRELHYHSSTLESSHYVANIIGATESWGYDLKKQNPEISALCNIAFSYLVWPNIQSGIVSEFPLTNFTHVDLWSSVLTASFFLLIFSALKIAFLAMKNKSKLKGIDEKKKVFSNLFTDEDVRKEKIETLDNTGAEYDGVHLEIITAMILSSMSLFFLTIDLLAILAVNVICAVTLIISFFASSKYKKEKKGVIKEIFKR